MIPLMDWYLNISIDDVGNRLQEPRSATLNALATDILPPEEGDD